MNPGKYTIEDVMKKLSPGHPVAGMLVNGALAETTTFSNYSNGLAYFITDGQVAVYDCSKVDGMVFGAADAAGAEAEEEEAEA